MKHFLLLITILNILIFSVSCSKISSLVYSDHDSISICLRHLNGTSSVGCQGKSFGGSYGVLYKVSTEKHIEDLDDKKYDAKYVAVVSPQIFSRAVVESLSRTGKCSGVLVPLLANDSATGVLSGFDPPAGFSDEVKSDTNPFGRDLMNVNAPFPIAAIAPTDVKVIEILRESLEYNEKSSFTSFPLYGTQVDGFMFATDNSETCLRRSVGQTRDFCWPVGGSSVYASTKSPEETAKSSVIFVSSTMDARSIFPDFAYGYNAYQSGLIVSLSVAAAISTIPRYKDWNSSIVFTAFNAESWGLAGSSRFFRDINEFQCQESSRENACSRPYFINTDFKKLSTDRLVAFIELGQLLYSNRTVYAHSKGGDSTIRSLMQSNAGSLDFKVASNADIPDSSSKSFLEFNPSKPQILLEDFDQKFTNPYFNSPYDSPEFVGANYTEKLCDTANMVLKSIYTLANPNNASIPLNSINVNCSLVSELDYCLNKNFSCPLVREIAGISGAGPIMRYVFRFSGDFASGRSHTPSVLSRFIFRYFAKTFAEQISDKKCVVNSDCDGDDVCASSKCVTSFARYHDAYGLGLEYNYALQRFSVVDPAKPSWTVSNFNTGGIRVLQMDNTADQIGQLFGGIFMTLLSIYGIRTGKQFIIHKLTA